MLPGICRAETTFCLGMSEPQAGSDLAAVRTRAERVPGGWRLNGHKIWTSHAHHATHIYVLARTSEGARKHEGLSEVLVDIGPGVSAEPIVDLAGEHHFNEVRLEDVFVPEHRLLGTEGRGWQQVVSHTAHRLHGAIGLTQEHPLHRHTLLLWEWRDRPDGAHADAEALGRLALTEGPDVVWNSLTTPAL